MNIGVYDPYLDDVGGGEKYMLTIAEFLSKNHDVSVFWNNHEDFEKAKKRFSLDLSNVKIKSNIFDSKTSFLSRFKTSKKYDAVILLSDGSIPFVSSDLYIHFQRPMEHIKLKPFTRHKIKRVKSFFCNSAFTKKFIDKTYKVDSAIIYPPVEIHPKKVKKQNVILHVGRFRPFDKTNGAADYKKQNVMIDVFKEMVSAGLKGWKFILAVSVNDQDLEVFKDLKKGSKNYPIEFEVNKKNDELWNYYSKSKIYWHASGYGEDLSKNPEYAEHFGISTVEAMGAGAVPVVFNAGGQKEIVENGINGFSWDTLGEFKQKTQDLIYSEKLMDNLSKKAMIKSKDFSKDSFCVKVGQMINE
jgi:glycosyltransferase involved in cell wall biosynthesis